MVEADGEVQEERAVRAGLALPVEVPVASALATAEVVGVVAAAARVGVEREVQADPRSALDTQEILLSRQA